MASAVAAIGQTAEPDTEPARRHISSTKDVAGSQSGETWAKAEDSDYFVEGKIKLLPRIDLDTPVATILLLGLIPVAMKVPALTALALVAMVCTMLIAHEALRYRDARAWIRSRRGEFTTDEVSRIARTPSRIGRGGNREV